MPSTKTISRAEHLNITQSGSLEDACENRSLGADFPCSNAPRGVEPTAHGAILIRDEDEACWPISIKVTDEFAGYQSGELGRVSVGTVAKPSIDLVVDVIEYLGEKLNRVNISLDVSTSPPLVARLLALELDFVVARIPPMSIPSCSRISTRSARKGRPVAGPRGAPLCATADLADALVDR